VHSGTDPPGETTLDPWLDDPFSDYDTDRSWRSPPPETSGSAQVRLSHPLFSGPQSPPAGPCLTSGPLLSLCAHGNARFRLQTPGQRPEGQKRFPISQWSLLVAHLGDPLTYAAQGAAGERRG